MEKNLTFIKLIIYGLLLGIASIMPGMSGGILAIAFGLYEPALDAIVNIKAHFKKSLLFLLPIFIGAVTGIFVFSVIMKPLIQNYEISIIYFFIGLVLGSLPSFLKTANTGGFRLLYILPLLLFFALGMIFAGAVDSNIKNAEITPLILLLSGGVLALGMVVPGVSSSFVLIQMGVYEKILSALLAFDFYYILWIGLGFLIIAVLLVKLLNIAFKKYHGFASYGALGFLISSIIAVYPGTRQGIGLIIDIFLLIIGSLFVYIFMKKTKK
ncbi:MAG: DUF368 domain-containing protein [Ruminococcaceae bacterium]|nr:DUF368 domain-containing protein [Oscillospiraceae bacterium]